MENKIGCFGSVLYFKIGTARCQSCPLQVDCERETKENETKLNQWYAELVDKAKTTTRTKRRATAGIAAITAPSASPRAARSATATKPLHATGAVLNKKPKQFVDAWCNKGIEFGDYKTGANPFKHCGNKFALVAMDYLLANRRCTKLQLTEEFMDKCGWAAGTAASHSNITFDAFEHLGIITIQDGNTAVLI